MGDRRGEIQVGRVPHARRVAELPPAHDNGGAVVSRPGGNNDAAVGGDSELDSEPRDHCGRLQRRRQKGTKMHMLRERRRGTRGKWCMADRSGKPHNGILMS